MVVDVQFMSAWFLDCELSTCSALFLTYFVINYRLQEVFKKFDQTHIVLVIFANLVSCPQPSRHTVVCQRPRNQKKTQGTQVCYLLVP